MPRGIGRHAIYNYKKTSPRNFVWRPRKNAAPWGCPEARRKNSITERVFNCSCRRFNLSLPLGIECKHGIAYICIDKQVHVLPDTFLQRPLSGFSEESRFFANSGSPQILALHLPVPSCYPSLSFSLFRFFSFSYFTCAILPPSPSFSLTRSLYPTISPAGSARFRALSNSTCVSCISKLVTRSKAARSGESNCIESQDMPQEYVERSSYICTRRTFESAAVGML